MLMKLTSNALCLFFCIFITFISLVNTGLNEYSTIKGVASSPTYKFDAKSGQFPWIITFKTLHQCMGTLIHPSWVITAASCLEDSSDPSYYHLQLGNPDKASFDKEQIRVASELHPYPQYKSTQSSQRRDYAHNIALMKMKMPFNTRETLSARTIALESDNSRTRTCIVIGLVNEVSNPNEKYFVLQFTTVFTFTFGDCLYRFRDRKKLTGMWNTVCAMGTGKYSYSGCSGDPGGPLICPTKDEEWKDSTEVQLVGISSWNELGIYCGAMSKYTDVGRFSEWVNGTMKGMLNTINQFGRFRDYTSESCSRAPSHTTLFLIGSVISWRFIRNKKPVHCFSF